MPTCSKCKADKEQSAFYARSGRCGLETTCKDCRKSANAKCRSISRNRFRRMSMRELHAAASAGFAKLAAANAEIRRREANQRRLDDAEVCTEKEEA